MKSIPKPGTILANHNLKLISQIGKGGMGLVFKAEEQTTGRFVAVKFVIPPGDLNSIGSNPNDTNATIEDRIDQRFRDEIKAAARINCPHIVTFYYAGEYTDDCNDPVHYAVFELVERGSLAQEIKSNGALRWNRTVNEVAIPLCSALSALHKAGIIHRDIKPDNLLHGDEYYKLGDFGISLFEEREAVTCTCEGALGTPGYIAPERLTQPNESGTEASDVYSAALVIIKASSGRLPFTAAETSGAMLVAEQVKTTVTPEALGKLGIPAITTKRNPSETARTILARAVSTKPEIRPSMDELLTFLKAVQQSMAATAACGDEGDKTKVRDSDESASLRNRALAMEADKQKHNLRKPENTGNANATIVDNKATMESQPVKKRPEIKEGGYRKSLREKQSSEKVTEERPVRGNAVARIARKKVSLQKEQPNWRKIIPASFLIIFLLGGLGYVAQNFLAPPPDMPWKIVDQRAADAFKQTLLTFDKTSTCKDGKLYEASPGDIIKWMQSIETMMITVEEHKYNLRDTNFEVKKKEIQTYLGQSPLKDFIKAEFYASKGQGIQAANAYRDSTTQLLQDMFLEREDLRKENPVAKYVLKKIVDALGQNGKAQAGKKTKTGKDRKPDSRLGRKSFARCLTKEENDDWFHFRMILPAKEFLGEDAYFIQCWQFISMAFLLEENKKDQRTQYSVMKPALGYLVHHERTRKLEAGNVTFLEDLFGSEVKEIPAKEEIRGQEAHVRLREIWEEAKKDKMHKGLLISKPIAISTLGNLNDSIEFRKNYDAFWRNYWLLVGDLMVEPKFDDERCGTFFWIIPKIIQNTMACRIINAYQLNTHLDEIHSIVARVSVSTLKQNTKTILEMMRHALLSTNSIINSDVSMTTEKQICWKNIALTFNEREFYRNYLLISLKLLNGTQDNSKQYVCTPLEITLNKQIGRDISATSVIQIHQLHLSLCMFAKRIFSSWPQKLNIKLLAKLPSRINTLYSMLQSHSLNEERAFAAHFLLVKDIKNISSFIKRLYKFGINTTNIKVLKNQLTHSSLCELETELDALTEAVH